MVELKFVPDNRNYFQVDGKELHDAPTPAVSVRCPHCRELGSFEVVRKNAFRYSKHGKMGGKDAEQPCFASIRICPNTACKGLAFTIETEGKIVEIEPPQPLDFSLDNLPARLQETLKEAVACHGAGAYRAAAMMVRRLLEEICDENNATGPNLHQRLASLKNRVVLPQPLFDAMDELKALGNDASHVEAKEYDNIGRAEAENSIELAKEILKALYQLQSLIARLQARKGAAT